MPFERSNSPL
ncbi:hypothetical protein BDFB_010424 [Asbolus verrucosus]|uniref:Uncharacterized protein n=1 Tax=Asbolus verrucosus TaxID=1661398 RepID=A0A482VFN3_ASBVE|nr:hypothetical protein BDFB_010424 [Asbolus verrucosus]